MIPCHVAAHSAEAAYPRSPASFEERVRHAQKLAGIGRFANVFAHDFNNLLTVIHAYTELALRDTTLSDRLREQLHAVRAAADSAAWLSRQLLVHSRRDTGRPAAVDVNLMLRDIHQLLQRGLPSASGAELRLQEGLSPVLADPGPLSQLLLAAVAHVVIALPVGGRLIIESATRPLTRTDGPAPAAGEDEGVSIRVVGAVGDAVTPLAAPLDTDASAASRSASGAEHVLEDFGVSFDAAREIARALQGELSVPRDTPEGWTVEIVLPKAGRPPEASPAGRLDASIARDTVVLLVDEEETVRRSVAALLRAQHCVVLTAATGDEALRAAALHAAPVQVLLSAPALRDMSVVTLRAAVARRSPAVRSIVMSGRHEASAPADATLEKPFTAAALAAALQAATRSRSQARPTLFPPQPDARS